MTSQALLLVIVGVACLMPRPAVSHGRMLIPAARNSVWRYSAALKHQYGLRPDYNDNEGFCGGFTVQMSNGYRCGVCGDNFASPAPRHREVGGTYVKAGARPIMGHYTPGQQATFTVHITANHKGWVSFSLCPVNDFTVEATQDCLDRHPVKLVNTSQMQNYDPDRDRVFDEYKHQIPHTTGLMQVHVIIPSDVTCSLCTLQWRYHTGNNWGPNPVTGESEPGWGPQEEFYACSDVSISVSGVSPPPVPSTTTTTATQGPTTTTTTTTIAPPGSLRLSDCLAAGLWTSRSGNSRMDRWCRLNCYTHNGIRRCPASHCNDECRQLCREKTVGQCLQ